MNPKQLSATIADDLFTDDVGGKAARLVLVAADGRELGGWAEYAAQARIESVLLTWTDKKRPGRRAKP